MVDAIALIDLIHDLTSWSGSGRKGRSSTVDEFHRINILVNNAAFQVHVPELAALSPEHFDETIKTNLYGYYHIAQAALVHMREGDAIINTGSVTGILGSGGLLDYSMTKGGIHAFTRAPAANLVPRGIRVPASPDLSVVSRSSLRGSAFARRDPRPRLGRACGMVLSALSFLPRVG